MYLEFWLYWFKESLHKAKPRLSDVRGLSLIFKISVALKRFSRGNFIARDDQLRCSWWSVNSNMLNNLMIPFDRLMLCRSSPALPYELETHKKIGSKVEVRSKFIIFPNFGLNRLSNFSFASQTHTSKSTRAFIILNLWRKTAFSSLHICTERVTKLRNSLFACVK